MAGEEPEQVELARGQPQRLPPFVTSRVRVDDEPVVREALLAAPSGSARRSTVRTRRQLARRERLRHVVVGAELETDDPVGLLAAGRQHDHRQARARADPAAELEPVRPGQHEVEHDEARRVALDELARPAPVGRLERLEALALQVADDDLADRRLVVDDENRGHARIIPGARVTRP